MLACLHVYTEHWSSLAGNFETASSKRIFSVVVIVILAREGIRTRAIRFLLEEGVGLVQLILLLVVSGSGFGRRLAPEDGLEVDVVVFQAQVKSREVCMQRDTHT